MPITTTASRHGWRRGELSRLWRGWILSSRWLLASLGTLFLAGGTLKGAEAITTEYQIKAAFLYNFTKFLEWPAESLPANGGPIIIAVLGHNPFGTELQTAVKGREVNGRRVECRMVEKIDEAKTTQILFVPASEENRLGEIHKALKGSSVLTVGETPHSAKAGCAISFQVEGDKVRFEINIDSADEARIKISAQLQKLAKTVRKCK